MKALVILAIFLALGLIFLSYKREANFSKLFLSLFILSSILLLAMVGNIMRSIIILFLTHIMALIFSYLGLLYYLFRGRKQWILWSLPIFTLALYLFFAWLGNEHITGIL